MPTYLYECEGCGRAHEDTHLMSEPHPDCPGCGAKYGEGFYQAYSAYKVNVIDSVPRTFGQQAERNAKRVGKEGLRRLAEEAGRKKRYTGPVPDGAERPAPKEKSSEIPGTQRMEKPLDPKTVKDPVKYIETGEK
jgi:putative FmdB family regulatory protein